MQYKLQEKQRAEILGQCEHATFYLLISHGDRVSAGLSRWSLYKRDSALRPQQLHTHAEETFASSMFYIEPAADVTPQFVMLARSVFCFLCVLVVISFHEAVQCTVSLWSECRDNEPVLFHVCNLRGNNLPVNMTVCSACCGFVLYSHFDCSHLCTCFVSLLLYLEAAPPSHILSPAAW